MLITDWIDRPVELLPLTDEALDTGLRLAASQYRATTDEDRCDRWGRAVSDLAVAKVAIEARREDAA